MTASGNLSANGVVDFESATAGPGAPKGRAKPPGSGRQKGTPNKINREIRQIAGRYTMKALRQAWKLAQEATDQAVQLKAVELLLSYGHGRPAQIQLVGGTGQPIQSEKLTVEISRRISEVFAEAKAVDPDKSVGETLDDQSLRVVSAISYLQASAEAAQSPREPAGSSASANGVSAAAAPAVTPAAPEVPPEVIDVTPEPEEPEAPAVGHTLAFLESDLTIIGLPPSRPGLPCGFELRRRGMRCRSGSWPLVLEEARKLSGGDLGPWIVQAPRAQTGQHYNTREQTITGIRRRASRSG